MLAATQRQRLGPLGTLVRFGLLALVPVLILGVVLGHEINVDVQARYLQTQLSSATLIAQVGIQPLLAQGQVQNGFSPAEIAAMDEKLQGASLSTEVRRLKVWNRAGTVVYSDRPAIIGKSFRVDTDLGEALAGTANANITDGQDDENEGDNLVGPLLQVYVPLVFKGDIRPSGAFEIYLPYAPIQAAIDQESSQLYLLLGAGLVIFYGSMFPIVFLADRWRRRAESTAVANLAVLERLNRMKSEFLIRMSHQFRTSMVGIEGFSEVIRDSERLDPDELRSFASDIHEDARRLDRAFNEMLELDEMESGRIEMRLEPTDLNHIVENVILSLRADNPARRVSWNPDRSLPRVPCDGPKMTQALANVVGNAIRYTRGEISVSTRLESDQVRVTVTDSGPGMPSDFDTHLFMGHGNGGGVTGLGLPIARQIVEMHGGRIWFESETGEGTTFNFALPLKARPSAELRWFAQAEGATG